MATCSVCGKTIDKKYKLCWNCKAKDAEALRWLAYMRKTGEERQTDLDAYYAHDCSMCGKEGANWHEPDGYFCGTCWGIWKS